MDEKVFPQGFRDAMDFSLIEALTGRRARRFPMGGSIPEGAFQYTSRHEPMPLTELETLMVLTAVAGNTGWNYLLPYNQKYQPYIPNYPGAAGGRTFPSAAGFETSEIFYTDDSGVYFFSTHDAPALVDRREDGSVDYEQFLEANRKRIRKLQEGRLDIPREEPYFESHNIWIANAPGSMLVMPVADLAQHLLLGLCYFLQNGYVLYDDINRTAIPGTEKFGDLADLENPLPLSWVEQYSLQEVTTELSCACYAGALMLQAMGLGGWLFNGLNPYAFLGASGNPNVPGLGFRYDTDGRWPLPNPTGLPGVFEGYCPPHYPDMRAAVEAVVRRKYGHGGPFNPETPGQFIDSPRIRSAAQVHDERFKECVTLQAQYIFDRFGKFPGTAPSIVMFVFLQAHHIDLEFYDKYYQPGAYLRTHADHMKQWH